VPVIATAEQAEYEAQRYSVLRAAEVAYAKAAIGIATKIGMAQRLCSVPVRVGRRGRVRSGSALSPGDGGKPAAGSLTNSPEPIRALPTPKISTGTARGPAVCFEQRARPWAAMQWRAPVSAKFVRCDQPLRSAARELTGSASHLAARGGVYQRISIAI
jgi:hypothetical protein